MAGSQEALGALISYSQDAISWWLVKKNGIVPPEAAIRIEQAFPDDPRVSRCALRPDIFGEATQK